MQTLESNFTTMTSHVRVNKLKHLISVKIKQISNQHLESVHDKVAATSKRAVKCWRDLALTM